MLCGGKTFIEMKPAMTWKVNHVLVQSVALKKLQNDSVYWPLLGLARYYSITKKRWAQTSLSCLQTEIKGIVKVQRLRTLGKAYCFCTLNHKRYNQKKLWTAEFHYNFLINHGSLDLGQESSWECCLLRLIALVGLNVSILYWEKERYGFRSKEIKQTWWICSGKNTGHCFWHMEPIASKLKSTAFLRELLEK